MVDDEVNWAEGVDLLGVSAESGHCVSHGCQVDHCGYSCEILEDDSAGFECNFNGLAGEFFPAEDVLDVFGGDFELIAVSDCAFEEDPDTIGEPFESGIVEGLDIVVGEGFSGGLDLRGNFLEGVGFGLGEGEPAQL